MSSPGVCWEVTLRIIKAQSALNKARSPVTSSIIKPQALLVKRRTQEALLIIRIAT